MEHQGALREIGTTPLIELATVQPTDGASISVKWEGANPTGSLKDRMALAMIEQARDRGDLDKGEPVVEFTGGSTGTSLGLVCAALDHPLYIVTADCFSEEKIDSMRALGATLEILETPDGTSYDGLFGDLRDLAEDVRERESAYFTDQFNNSDQLTGYQSLGAEILEECPDVDEFVMSVGTGGCAMGTAKALEDHGADIMVSLVEPEESPIISESCVGSHAVQGTAIVGAPPLLEPDLYDNVYTVPSERAIDFVRRLARREGLLVGTSSGMNVAAAMRAAEKREPDETVVTVACDTGLKYLSGGLFKEIEKP